MWFPRRHDLAGADLVSYQEGVMVIDAEEIARPQPYCRQVNLVVAAREGVPAASRIPLSLPPDRA